MCLMGRRGGRAKASRLAVLDRQGVSLELGSTGASKPILILQQLTNAGIETTISTGPAGQQRSGKPPMPRILDEHS